MNDHDQWELYGMFALLLDMAGEHIAAECCGVEADGEGMDEQFEAGFAEMKIWLRFYAKTGIKRNAQYIRIFSHCYANPLTLH